MRSEPGRRNAAGPTKKLPQVGQEPVEAVESRPISPDGLYNILKLRRNAKIFSKKRQLFRPKNTCTAELSLDIEDGRRTEPYKLPELRSFRAAPPSNDSAWMAIRPNPFAQRRG